MKRIHHTKYEHNRSIFDIVQKFVSNSKLSKMLQICSNSTWWIHFVSWFHTTNMRKIGAFLTMSKISHFISKIWELSKMLWLFSYLVWWVKNLGFSADRLIRHYFPFKGLFRHSPLSMRIHTHHWSIRNCISTIPDTTMIAKVIMSSPSILVDFFEDNSWSRWGSNPGPLAWEADMLTTTPPGLRFLLTLLGLMRSPSLPRLPSLLGLSGLPDHPIPIFILV